MSNSTKFRLLAALFALLAGLSFVPTAKAEDYCRHPLRAEVKPNQSRIHGTAELCLDENNVSVSMRTEDHTPGNAYTIWFAYIDDPSQCGNYPGGTPGTCSDPDFVTPSDSPIGVFGRMDGKVARNSGRLRFTANLHDLRFSHNSMVWLIMFEHGPASTSNNRFLARQLLTPQLPVLGAPGEGALGDGDVGHGVALAIFNIR
jgi:hypothetical protein